jgi:hypothetical protein
MDQDDRPDWFTAFFVVPDTPGHPPYGAAGHTFDKPPTWTYYDDQVPKWYADWESEKRRRLSHEVSFRPASEVLREAAPDTT